MLPKVVPLPQRPVARQRHRVGGLDPAHGRAARRGRPDRARVPRRRRPAPHPLAGDRAHRRAHGPPGGPTGEASGRRRPRHPRGRARRVRAQQLPRVVRHDRRVGHRPRRGRRVCRAPAHRRRRAPTPACTTTRRLADGPRHAGPGRARARGRPAGRAARRERADLAGRTGGLRRRPGRRRRRPHAVRPAPARLCRGGDGRRPGGVRRARPGATRAADRPGRRDAGDAAVLGLDDDRRSTPAPPRRSRGRPSSAARSWGPGEPGPARRGPARRARHARGHPAPDHPVHAASTWFRPSVLLVALVALVGMGLRTPHGEPRRSSWSARSRCSSTRPSLLHGRGHLVGDLLPTPETGRAFGVLLQEAQRRSPTTPRRRPSNRGTILAISLLIGLTAVAVDAIGVTYRSPALAGIPLLSAFLASATNSGDGLGAWYAVPGALAWLALVGRQGVRSLRAWGTAAPHSSPGRSPTRPPRSRRSAGWSAWAPSAVADRAARAWSPTSRRPSSPTGWAAAPTAAGAPGPTSGWPRASTSRATSATARPTRCSATAARPTGSSRCASASSTPTVAGSGSRSADFTFVPVDGQIPGPIAGPEVPRRVERISVVDNGDRRAPGRAARRARSAAPSRGGTWNMTVQGLVQLTAAVARRTRPSSSSSTPRTAQFAADLDNPPGRRQRAPGRPARRDRGARRARPDHRRRRHRAPGRPEDPGLPARLAVHLLPRARRAGGRRRPVRRAAGPLPRDQARATACSSPRRWSCSRARPASRRGWRSGFLPGSIDGDDRVVRVSDAHAWPELYFPRLGWVRFEPTPGTRSGVAPGVQPRARPAGGSSSSASPTTSTSTSSAAPVQRRRRATSPTDTDRHHRRGSASSGAVRFVTRHATTLLVVLLVLLVAAIVPFGAWLARRRARAARPRRRRPGRGGVAVAAAAAAGHRFRAARRGHAAAGVPADRPRRLPHHRRERRPRPGRRHPGAGPVRPTRRRPASTSATTRAPSGAARSRVAAAPTGLRALLLPEEGKQMWRSSAAACSSGAAPRSTRVRPTSDPPQVDRGAGRVTRWTRGRAEAVAHLGEAPACRCSRGGRSDGLPLPADSGEGRHAVPARSRGRAVPACGSRLARPIRHMRRGPAVSTSRGSRCANCSSRSRVTRGGAGDGPTAGRRRTGGHRARPDLHSPDRARFGLAVHAEHALTAARAELDNAHHRGGQADARDQCAWPTTGSPRRIDADRALTAHSGSASLASLTLSGVRRGRAAASGSRLQRATTSPMATSAEGDVTPPPLPGRPARRLEGRARRGLLRHEWNGAAHSERCGEPSIPRQSRRRAYASGTARDLRRRWSVPLRDL